MVIIETYSHLNGTEFLAVKKPALYREVLNLVDRCRGCNWESARRPYTQALRDVTESFDASAREHGWRKTRSGLEKDRVVLNLHGSCDPEGLSVAGVAGRILWDYTADNIDVGIEIAPVNSSITLAGSNKTKENLVGSFEQMVSEIRSFGRNTPCVPLLVIGVTP